MEIKQGSVDIPLFIKLRQNGAVVTIANFLTSYDADDGVYSLEAETMDKSATKSIVGSVATDGIDFTLTEDMFTIAQRVWIVTLKYALTKTSNPVVTDFGLYNFEIKVTKPQSVNTR